MAFTSLEGTVIHKGPYPLLGFTASGTICGGQAVYSNSDDYVIAGAGDKAGLGIALYDSTNGEGVSIVGPGNIAYCRISSAGGTLTTTHGLWVTCGVEGYCKTCTSGTNAFGKIVDLPTTQGGIGKILIG